MLVCRICLTIIMQNDYLSITSTYFEDKPLIRLMETIGQIPVPALDHLPQQVCHQCGDKLFKCYELQQQIQYVENNLSNKQLMIVTLNDVPTVCFREEFRGNARLNSAVHQSAPLEQIVQIDDFNSLDKPDLVGENDLLDLQDYNATSFDPLEELKIEENDPLEVQELNEENNIAIGSEIESESLPSQDQPLFCCDICGTRYQKEYHLVRHKKSEHPDKSFNCDVCDKRYDFEVDFKNHQLTHNIENLDRAVCKTCKRIVKKYYLKRHMQMHKDVIFNCNLCDRTFKTKMSLYYHKKSWHSQKKDKHHCSTCSLSFTESQKYWRHMRSKHLGIKYKCTACSKMYTLRVSCIKHVKKCHPEQAHDKSVIVATKNKNDPEEITDP